MRLRFHRAEAQKMLDEARAQVEKLRNESSKEGFDQGHEEGFQKGYAEAQRLVGIRLKADGAPADNRIAGVDSEYNQSNSSVKMA